MNATTLTANDVHERIGAADRTLILYFGATWCPPCHAIAPVLDEIAAEHIDELEILALDVDVVPELVVQYSIASAPTLVVVNRGEVELRIVGARPKDALVELLSPYLC